MPDEPEILHQLGTFEPHEATRLLSRLEADGIRFELERDDSALAQPNRALQLYLGMYPEGSKLVVFVPASHLEKALAVVKELFPV
jgi:hypothetical protein